MKTMELERFGITELSPKEKEKIEGGNPIWIGIGIGLGVMVAYDFACGVYSGIKQELAK
jgi:hypothetical protein